MSEWQPECSVWPATLFGSINRPLPRCFEGRYPTGESKDGIRKAQERERKEGRPIIIPLNLDGYLISRPRRRLHRLGA